MPDRPKLLDLGPKKQRRDSEEGLLFLLIFTFFLAFFFRLRRRQNRLSQKRTISRDSIEAIETEGSRSWRKRAYLMN